MPTFLSRARGYSLESANLIFGEIVVVDGILASLAGGWLGDRLLPRMKGSYYFVSAVSMGLGVPVMIVALFNQGPWMVPAIAVAAFLLLLNTSPLNTALVNSVGSHIRATAIAVNIFLFHLSGRRSFANAHGICCRPPFAAGCLHPSGHRHGGFVCHTVLRHALRSSRTNRQRARRCRSPGGMSYFHWIAGCTLALAWIWRLVDAALGVPKIADISRPEWDRTPPGNPRVSIIVPACNEAADIEATLARLLALDYDNYEVIAVDDRSTDRTGEIMEKVAVGRGARTSQSNSNC